MDDALKEAIAAADLPACILLLGKLKPPLRRAVSSSAHASCKELKQRMASEAQEPGKGWEKYQARYLRLAAQLDAALLVAIATGSASELTKLAKRPLPKETAAALATTMPDWIGDAAELLVSVDPRHDHIARDLVRRGLSKRPTHDNYILGLCGDTRFGKHPFDADPELFEYEAWRMFEVEGGGESSLAARDKYTSREKSWTEAFLRHMRAGNLDRGRLIDATLDALARDFAPFRAGWFSRFHGELAVSAVEKAGRRDRYLHLLQSAVPATVSMAFATLQSIDATTPIAAGLLVAALHPVCLSRHKGIAVDAVKWLRGIGKREASSLTDVATALANALAHESVDVQKAAMDGLQECGAAVRTGELEQLIGERLEGIAPSLRKRAVDWLASATGAPGPARTAKRALVAVPAAPTKVRSSLLYQARAIIPISTQDELIDAFSSLLEEDGDPDEVERVFDGIARLGAERRVDFDARVGPLAKRARKLDKPHLYEPVLLTLIALARAWAAAKGAARASIEGSSLAAHMKEGHRPAHLPVLWRRVVALASQLDAGTTGVGLLSAPTHRGGLIAPDALVRRLIAHKQDAPNATDFCLALLRLATAGRPAALRGLEKINREGECFAALTYALGGKAKVGPTSALWAAACRARTPRITDPAVEKRHPHLGPDGATAASFCWNVKSRKSHGYTFHSLEVTVTPPLPSGAKVDPDLIATLRHLEVHAAEKSYARWLATLWPAGSESYFARAAPHLELNSSEWNDIAYYEALCAPFLQFGPMATLTLAMGLGAKEPSQSGMSADAAISAFDSQRLSGKELGLVMRDLRSTGFIKLKRWAAVLETVAGASPVASREVAIAIQTCLRGDPARAPRDEGALLSLLVELLAEHDAKLVDGAAREYVLGTKRARAFRPYMT